MAETPQFAPGDVVVHTVRPEWGEGIVDRAQLVKHEDGYAQRLVVKFTHKGRITLNTGMAPLAKKSELDAARKAAPESKKTKRNNHVGEDAGDKANDKVTQNVRPEVSLEERPDNNADSKTSTNPHSSPHSSKEAGNTMRNDTSTLNPSKRKNDGGWLASLEAKKSSNGNGQPNSDELRQLPDALADPFLTLEQRVEAALDTFRFSLEARALIDWAIGQTGLDDPMSRYTRHELEQGFDWFCRDRDLQLKELVREAKSRGRQEMLEGVRRRLKLPAAISALDKARNSA